MPLQPNFLERFLISRGEVPGLLLDVALSSQQFWALMAAMEIGFFEPWAGSEEKICTVDELCAHTEASQRGIRRLVNALEPLGYLDEADGGYRLSGAARRSLPLGRLSEIAPFFRYQMLASQEAARGVREAPEDGIIGWEPVQSGEVGRSYQAAMRWIASQSVGEVVEKVDLPEGAERMLDVGGSHGLYTLAFCREHPELRGTVLDWEIGLENARQTLEENPEVADRIDLVERDFEKEELPTEYDFAFLGQIVHGLSPDGNRNLFEKLGRATTDRGTVAILDQLAGVSGSAFARAVAGLLGYQLFLFTGGRNYRYDQLKAWLTDAGFPHVSREKLQQPGFSLVIARKNPGPEWAQAISSWFGR